MMWMSTKSPGSHTPCSVPEGHLGPKDGTYRKMNPRAHTPQPKWHASSRANTHSPPHPASSTKKDPSFPAGGNRQARRTRVDVALAGRRKDVLDELQRLFAGAVDRRLHVPGICTLC
eukprot:1947060-Rhodomonas_salina.4